MLDDRFLDQARREADPLADDCIARLLGPWPQEAVDAQAPQWQRLAWVNRAIAGWRTNADVADWQPDAELPAELVQPLRDYLRDAQALPDWADAAQLDRAETLFFEEGVLSCLLLFCASLPECYVVPDLSEVLQATAQLEARTEHRIRATAAMIFPVMMKGGLTSPQGSGRAQVLKVRLIHATVRHLLLRGHPQAAGAPLAPLQALAPGMHATLYAHGWDLQRDGLPCNQEELAYTLLTFGYVILRGLHRLGVPHRPADERAILHTWNVMASLLGVKRELMVDDMAAASQLFALLQARGRRQQLSPDPRPPLGQALVRCMAAVIPWPVFKPMPVLLTRYLIGTQAAGEIGLGTGWPVPLRSRLLFWLLLGLARGIDTIGQLLVRGFSLSRLFGRLVGYQLLTKLLLDQTRPLRLPEATLQQMQGTVAGWGRDPRAPEWLNRFEACFTNGGDWRAPPA